MRRIISVIAALALLATGATGCTALLTGGKRDSDDRRAYLTLHGTPTWTSTNASRPS